MRRIKLVIPLSCAASLLSSGCSSNEPKLISNQTNVENANARGSSNTASQPSAPAQEANQPARASMGEAIDTTAYDNKIQGLEEKQKAKPNNAALRKELAHAYLERGNALTQARQYQAALGDYRRTLRLDPENKDANYWSQTIIGILQQMNRPVPAEGAEPTPIKQS